MTTSKTLRIQLKLAKLPGQLPGEDFLQAFAYCYNLQLWIHHGVAMPIIYCKEGDFGTDEPTKRCHLQCISGIHYNPLRATSIYVQEHRIPKQPALLPPNEFDEEMEGELNQTLGDQSVYTIDQTCCSCVRGKGTSTK